MAKDVSDTVRDALGHAVRSVVKNAIEPAKKGRGPLSGVRGIAAGAGLAAMAPLAKKGVDKLQANGASAGAGAASKAGERVGSKLKETVGEAGGPAGILKDALTSNGNGDGGGDTMPGVGDGRRMPIQQAVDVAVPLETAYNQWTQFEDWPHFMHRVTQVVQDDDCTLKFKTKIWGKTKEFEAKIETQRPDQRIKWKVAQGITHSGVVTFHELAPSLTRIEVNLDIDPGSLIEKAARGMRHVKRAVRADLARYKAFIEMQELETGAWRGVIEGGEVVDQHDDDYDDERDYSEVDDIFKPEEEKPKAKAAASSSSSKSSSRSSGGSSKRSGSGSSSSGKSSSGRSRRSPAKSSSAKSSTSRTRGATNGGSSSRRKSTSGGSSSRRSTAKKGS